MFGCLAVQGLKGFVFVVTLARKDPESHCRVCSYSQHVSGRWSGSLFRAGVSFSGCGDIAFRA